MLLTQDFKIQNAMNACFFYFVSRICYYIVFCLFLHNLLSYPQICGLIFSLYISLETCRFNSNTALKNFEKQLVVKSLDLLYLYLFYQNMHVARGIFYLRIVHFHTALRILHTLNKSSLLTFLKQYA